MPPFKADIPISNYVFVDSICQMDNQVSVTGANGVVDGKRKVSRHPGDVLNAEVM
jgi:hypothetical protein